MKLTAIIYSIVLSLILTGSSLCYGGSITYSSDIEINGVLRLKDSPICFSDNTCMSTAVFSDGSAIWGQITGYIDDQLDLSVKFATKEDKANKNVAGGYVGLNTSGKIGINTVPHFMRYTKKQVLTFGSTPIWHNQGLTWTEITDFSTEVNVSENGSGLDLVLTDNVGISGLSWCNLGIFIDDYPIPECYGSWSGDSYNLVFHQVSVQCFIPNLNIGLHTLKVKHRSQNCTYGNYWNDDYSTQRSLQMKVY